MSERAAYIAYRVARAYETLDEAQLLFDNGHHHACVNRLYYACFYAVNGLLLAHNLTPARHAGVLRLFSEHFIRTNIIDEEDGKFYHRLFQFRQKSDYEDNFQIDADRVKSWLPTTQAFVENVVRLIDQVPKPSST